MNKSFDEMTHEERVTWAAGHALDRFVTEGGKGLRSAMHLIMSATASEAFDRGQLQGIESAQKAFVEHGTSGFDIAKKAVPQ